jgi:hypothetical protein
MMNREIKKAACIKEEYRLGNLILTKEDDGVNMKYFRIKNAANDWNIRWREDTEMFAWIETCVNDHSELRPEKYKYLEHLFLTMFCLTQNWQATPDGMFDIMIAWRKDLRRTHPEALGAQEDDDKIIEEERKRHVAINEAN